MASVPPVVVVYPKNFRPETDFELDALCSRARRVQDADLSDLSQLERNIREIRRRGLDEMCEPINGLLRLVEKLSPQINGYVSLIGVLLRQVEHSRPPRRDGNAGPIRFRRQPSPPAQNGARNHYHSSAPAPQRHRSSAPPPRHQSNSVKRKDLDEPEEGEIHIPAPKRTEEAVDRVKPDEDLGF